MAKKFYCMVCGKDANKYHSPEYREMLRELQRMLEKGFING